MADYKKMYALLCREVSTALDELPDVEINRPACQRLQNALLVSEDIYIQTCGPDEKE